MNAYSGCELTGHHMLTNPGHVTYTYDRNGNCSDRWWRGESGSPSPHRRRGAATRRRVSTGHALVGDVERERVMQAVAPDGAAQGAQDVSGIVAR